MNNWLKPSAEINVQDKEGWFPLMHASRAENLDMVQLLVAYGASVHLRNSDGQTIFEICSNEFLSSPLYHELVRIFGCSYHILHKNHFFKFQMLLSTVNEDLSECCYCSVKATVQCWFVCIHRTGTKIPRSDILQDAHFSAHHFLSSHSESAR